MSRKPAATVQLAQPIVDDIVNGFDLRSAFEVTPLVFWRPEGDGGTGDDDDDNDDDDAGGTGGTGEDDTGGDGTPPPGDDIKDPEKKRLHDEAARHRTTAKAEKDRADQLQNKLKEYEDKDKSELQKAQDDLKAAQAENATLRSQIKDQAVKLAFHESGAAATFRNSKVALKLLNLEGIEPDKDSGEVDDKEIKKRADDLGKEQPYLLRGEDDSGTGDDDGQPSGRSTNNRKGSKDDQNKEALAKKYPALRDRV